MTDEEKLAARCLFGLSSTDANIKTLSFLRVHTTAVIAKLTWVMASS